MRKERFKHIGWMLVIVVVGILWSVNAHALERRVGSLEFSYTAPPDPVGMVILNHISDQKPSITYQVPPSPGGNFTTPWGILIDSGRVTADTMIMLTNPDGSATLSIDVMLRDKNGDVGGAACNKTITLGPKETRLKAVRALFSGCPAITP